MKKLILLFALLSVVTLNFAGSSTAKIKSYYSGDAINYQGQIIVASTNTGNLELFTLNNDNLELASKISPDDNKYNIFYDVMLDQRWNKLYVYVTSGRYLYKYNATNLDNLVLENKIKDNSWDWFGDIDKVDGQLVTKGNKFVKIWDDQMQVIDSYRLTNRTNPYNIVFGYRHSNNIYNINNDQLEIFDRGQREIIKTINLNYSENSGNHRLHPDALDNFLYVVDDEALKKYNHLGGYYKSYDHNSGHGYDVIYSTDGKHIYFSNGLGVHKIKKGDFTKTTSFTSSSLNIDQSWAMGLTRVMDNNWNELIVVFNNSNILILNNQLQPVAKVLASETDDSPVMTEDLWLNISQLTVQPNEVITVYGGGFAKNEKIKLNLENRSIITTADNQGRFEADLRVPFIHFRNNQTELRTDIQATGMLSEANYSIGLTIEQ